jgi:hypothetical protein
MTDVPHDDELEKLELYWARRHVICRDYMPSLSMHLGCSSAVSLHLAAAAEILELIAGPARPQRRPGNRGVTRLRP